MLYIGAAFLFAYYGYSFWKRERYYILLCTLPVLALTDRMERRIPNRFLLILGILRIFILAGEIAAYPLLWTDFTAHACTCLLYTSIGFELLEMVRFNTKSDYARKKVKETSEVYGRRYAEYYYYVQVLSFIHIFGGVC